MYVDFLLTGEMPMLMHADDVEQADELLVWRRSPENKNLSVAGDDRSPAWTWQTYLYNDGEHVALPTSNLCVCIRQAAAQIILKKQKTFKELSQSGMLPVSEFLEFRLGNGKQLAWPQIMAIRDEPFAVQSKVARDLGFKLDVRRVKVGQSKHVRVRPRFNEWSVRGTLNVVAQELTPEVVARMFDLAGRVGLGDWRPGCRTPGAFGMFAAAVKVRR